MKGQNVAKAVYTVEEIRAMLSISKNSAYSFIKNNPPFQVIRIGESYRVLKSSFDEWLNGSDNNG